ncbi:PAXNEB protein-domain-containing protein [Coniochaeta sp. 2T2.1]|nr:PAXNEB protein-domain-containing protein [Coniochaeta sp. 2T2.1]
MSFRKRNTVISTAQNGQASPSQPAVQRQLAPGLRPSPLDGRLTTSTGTSSLDHLLAGHVGLPLGTSLLIEEQGTTDFAGVVLRYYAAEGLVQGHHVHVLGFPEAWRYDLPAIAAADPKRKSAQAVHPDEQKMKIAWRYEALGNTHLQQRREEETGGATYCHSFDLSKRLAPGDIKGTLQSYPSMDPRAMSLDAPPNPGSYLTAFVKTVQGRITAAGPSAIHRIVVPSLLSPTLFPPIACQPGEVLRFLHSLRALLRQFSIQVTAIVTLPISLFPRSNGLTRWIELLSDGVIELIPLPANPGAPPPSSSDSKSEDKCQGLLRVHSLPIYHEKGGGGAENNHFREDLTFSLSASKGMVIKPFSLPPLGEEGHPEKSPASTRVVRISKIAGRYLVFDLQDVVYLRRHHNICAVFVGTMPQNPTQNIFMGLPVELLAEEASVLVNKGAAYIADDAVEHLSRLSAMGPASRKAYLQSLKTQRGKAQMAIDEEKAARSAEAKATHLGTQAKKKQQQSEPAVIAAAEEESLFNSTPQPEPATTVSPVPTSSASSALAAGITPGTSALLVEGNTELSPAVVPKPSPLFAHLNSKGYFITPGLRFGGDYSVYPGDPFRFHAHFMATSYEWEEEITMLDLVASGRLGTAVKKGYMLGGQKPREAGDARRDLVDGGEVRAFCMEWAGM